MHATAAKHKNAEIMIYNLYLSIFKEMYLQQMLWLEVSYIVLKKIKFVLETDVSTWLDTAISFQKQINIWVPSTLCFTACQLHW